MPDTAGAKLALVLRTYQRGQLTFEEPRRFHVSAAASGRTAVAGVAFD